MVVSIGLLSASSPCSADLVTFEGYASGTILTNQDFGSGVTFAGAMILTKDISLPPTFPPRSGVNVIFNPGGGAMTLNFSNAVDFFGGYFTYNDSLLVQAYDSNDNLIASSAALCDFNTMGAGCSAPNELVQVTAVGSIWRVVISDNYSNIWTLDDASFTGSRDPSTTVPLPATAWLLFSGLGGLGFIGRRRRTH